MSELSSTSGTPWRLDDKRLKAVRESLDLSQAELAALLRQIGHEFGEPNGCTKRLVQKWESGEHATCRPNYRRALNRATGRPFAELCFPIVDETGAAVSANPLAPGGAADAAVLDSVILQLTELKGRFVAGRPRYQVGAISKGI